MSGNPPPGYELADRLALTTPVQVRHVKVLDEAGLVRVVRTRRVRAIDERFYGRTARLFYVSIDDDHGGESLPLDVNDFQVAAREFDDLPRSGDTVYGFAAGIYPTEHPRLPPAPD